MPRARCVRFFVCFIFSGQGAPRGRGQDPPAFVGAGRARETASGVPHALRALEPLSGLFADG